MTDPAYARYDQPLVEELMVCSVCGATVDWSLTDKHTDWHRRIEARLKSIWEQKIG